MHNYYKYVLNIEIVLYIVLNRQLINLYLKGKDNNFTAFLSPLQCTLYSVHCT